MLSALDTPKDAVRIIANFMKAVYGRLIPWRLSSQTWRF